MLFNSFDFLFFFPVVAGLYLIIPRKCRGIWLLLASYYFYMSWNAAYALLILFSTVVTYLCGLFIPKSTHKKLVLGAGITVNLGILFTFKYLNFFLENISGLFGLFGLPPVSAGLSLLLPVGISFYTFQALGYAIDVYRGRILPEKNFLRYALFVSFFPQLVAGPIERSENLLTQMQKLEREKLVTYEKFVSGFSMMCYGMFLKMVLADRLSVFVDAVWENLQAVGLVEGAAAAIAFSFQIYCDFGAYSVIAIGAARVMGFELMENFNTPYFAVSITDFWRRWHISLSGWLRDYLYIPLGGSRCSKGKKYRNIMITFLLSGLWHGANWTYVVWGGLHGAFQVIGQATQPLRIRVEDKLGVNREAESYTLGRIIVTFALTCFAWIFFRAATIGEALLFIKQMIARPNPWALFDESLYQFGLDRRQCTILLGAFMLLVIFDLIRYFKKEDFGAFMVRQSLWFRWLLLIALMASSLVFGEYGIDFDSAQFIYFTF